MPSRLSTLAAAALAAVTLAAGARRVGPLPALGALLDPVNGVWALARTAELPREAAVRLPGLGARARVLYDVRGVPHIFAASENDAYRALGYVVARDRLFQLDVQTLAGSGRITELAGARALDVDRVPRRLGMPWAAERKLAAMDTASTAWRAIRAYGDGINAYIEGMTPSDLPLEYRLTGRRPPHWEPLFTMHLLERMAWTLSYDDQELDRERVAALVGRSAANALWPLDSPIQEPIQPNGQSSPSRRFVTLPPPGAPDAAALRVAALLEATRPPSLAPPDLDALGGARGSNSWAVAPRRTRDGHALLAGDPHLTLTLPSLWYEAHLVVPGVLDVYGVTIPGAPTIIIGFNRDVAWSFTNAYADAVDFYAETVDDVEHPTAYRLDGAWRPLERRLEVYRAPDGSTIATDTLYLSHRGPLRREGDRWISMRWTALEPSSETEALAGIMHARNAQEWLAAMRVWKVPAQNGLVADRQGHIAIRSAGRVPLRPGDGRGYEIRDGSTSASDWTGDRAVERLPTAMDPAQGYLASANQQPVDPRQDSSYYGSDFRDPWRALHINELLRADSAVTPDAMRRWQTDAGSARADLFVPAFLAVARREIAAGRGDSALSRAARLLGDWDRRYTKSNRRAVLFENAMRALANATWDELVRPGATRGEPGARVATPATIILAELLDDSLNAWWDDRSTPAVERRDAIVAASLREALARTEREHGAPDGAGWTWSGVQHANIHHLLRIPALSALDLPIDGGPSTLNPSAGQGTDGASWRMVVELGPEVRAWGTYPGGQSGNPASARYRDRLGDWLTGTLDTLIVPRDSTALRVRRAALTLLPAR